MVLRFKPGSQSQTHASQEPLHCTVFSGPVLSSVIPHWDAGRQMRSCGVGIGDMDVNFCLFGGYTKWCKGFTPVFLCSDITPASTQGTI